MNKTQLDAAYAQADEYRRLVLRRTGIKPTELVCPREQSDMTPCIARDGQLAVAESVTFGGVCVGCERDVARLLLQEQEKGN